MSNYDDEMNEFRKEASEMVNLKQILDDWFGGVITFGGHPPGGQCCALELASVARGRRWSSNPEYVGIPEIHKLNDAFWSSNEARTIALLPVLEDLWDWPSWTQSEKYSWVSRVGNRTIREILPIALREAKLILAVERCEAGWPSGDDFPPLGNLTLAVRYAVKGRDKLDLNYIGDAIRFASSECHDADELLNLACRIWQEEASRR